MQSLPVSEQQRAQRERQRERPARWRGPVEGWDVLALHLLLVGCAATAVQTSGWNGLTVPLPVLAILGALFGAALAKSAAPDAFAHLLAVLGGSGAALLMVALPSDELSGSLLGRIKLLGRRSIDWYLGRGDQGSDDPLLISLLMGTLIWLLAYLAAWTLFRRGWLFASLLLPGFLLLVNLGYAPDPESGAVIVYLLASGVLAARYHLFRRQRQWARWGMVTPGSMASRFFATGAIVAVLAVVGGWLTPQSLAQASLDPLVSRIEQPLERAERALTGWWDGEGSGADLSQLRESGRYSSFGESFAIGGPLRLSDDPTVLLDADRPSYLVAQHYDAYSGSGWSSTVERTFDGEGEGGQQYSPEMTFQADQDVPLSSQVRGERTPVAGQITPLRPSGDVVLTTDTYMTANIPTSVRLSWRKLDTERFEIGEQSDGSLPPDLQRMAILLDRAEFASAGEGLSPAATDPAIQAEIVAEQAQLIRRFLEVDWQVGEDGRATELVVSGQMPVYDDVEAVFARENISTGNSYTVTGLASTAQPDQLRTAGTDYPAHVSERYLQLPATITPRTEDLARDLTRETSNPFDAATAIETYLRNTITYVENVPVPPRDQDVVDFVLFDDQRGYCEYYASAMTVLLRTQGIPARMVVGFYPGTFDTQRDGFLYLERNAHAWVEVYFPEYGWIAFEPTASQPTRDFGEGFEEPLVESTPPAETLETLDASTPSDEVDGVSTPTDDFAPLVDEPEAGGPYGTWLGIGAAMIGAAVLVGGVLFAAWVLPLRGLSPGDALYARLLRFGRLVGMRPDATTTPQEFAKSLGDAVPQSRRPAMQIVQVYEVNRYGQRGADAGLLGGAAKGWRELRRHVLGARWRARQWRREHADD